MPTRSLGGDAAQVRVRRVTDDEAFLLGALHLQALRRAGVVPDPGQPSHVEGFARSWQQRSGDLPAWVAEGAGRHVGMAICRVPVLPRLGRGVPELVALEPLSAGLPEGADAAADEAVALALVRAVVTWGGREGHPCVDVAPDVAVPAAVLDAARADVLQGSRISLPTRP